MFLIALDHAGRLEPETIDASAEWLASENEPDIDQWMSRMTALLRPPPRADAKAAEP